MYEPSKAICKSITSFVAILLAASLLESNALAVTILSSDGNGADHYVNEANLSSTPARDHRLFLRRGSSDHLVTYIRFDVSSVTDPISDAVIELSLITTGASVVNLYGLNDDTSETTLWEPNTINYNTAPGMGVSDGSLSTIDLDLSKVTSLGSYTIDQIATSGVPETRTLTSVAIKDFLNADSNGLVTFMIERQSGTSTIQFRSSRPRSTDPAWLPTEHAPRLVLSTQVPLAGDFDADGDVDGADFVAWQTNFPLLENATLAQGDADDDGDVDGADFDAWQNSFPSSASAVTPVPEPAAGILILLGVMTAAGIGRLRRRHGP